MQCTNCYSEFTIKSTNEYVSLMCGCQIFIIYPDLFTTRKSKKDYNPNFKKNKEKQ